MRVRPGLGAGGRLKAEDSWEKGVWIQPAPLFQGPVRQGLQLSPDLYPRFVLNALGFVARMGIERIGNRTPVSSASRSLDSISADPQGRQNPGYEACGRASHEENSPRVRG